MNTPGTALIALVLLLSWASPAPGGDDPWRRPDSTRHAQDVRRGQEGLGKPRHDDLFRLDSRGRRDENPFRIDGGRRNDHLFRLDGDGRGRGGKSGDADKHDRDRRKDDGKIRNDDRRHDDRRHDGQRYDDRRRDDRRRDDRRYDDRRRDDRRYDDRRYDDRRRDDRRYDDRRHDDRRDTYRRDGGFQLHVSARPASFSRQVEYRRVTRGGDFRSYGSIGHRHVRRLVYDIPPRHAVVLHGRDRYHYHAGRFYRPWNSGFFLVRPPLGLIVLSLPLGSRTVLSAGITYHVYGDVYYRRVPAGYVVVEPVRVPARDWPGRVSVVTDLLNIRYGPDEREEIIAQTGRYTVLNVLGSAPGWLYVEIDGEDVRGWVMERYVSANLGRG